MLLNSLISDFSTLDFAALMAISLIGLPHGAADGAIAGYIGYTRQPSSLFKFFGLYIAMAVLVIFFWMLFPTISLMVFLTISIIHFGLDVARTKQGWMSLVQGYAHGCVVIVGISQSHKEEVLQIYSFLIGKDAGPVWVMIDFISIIFLIVLVFYTFKAILDTKWRLEFIELLVLLILFSQLPPLVSFAIYFCGLHSVRHFRNIWLPLRNTIPLRNICLQIASFTCITWALGGLIIWLAMFQVSADVAFIRIIFIGLAALTVPHMILVDGLYHRHLSVTSCGKP